MPIKPGAKEEWVAEGVSNEQLTKPS